MGPRRLRAIGLSALAVVVIAALAIFGLRSQKSSSVKAPELPGETLIGPPATVGKLLAGARGRPALVLFWASWCEPCKREAPEIERFSQTSFGKGRIVGVDWSDGLAGAKEFLAHYRWSFPNARDSEGLIGNKYGLTGLPTTFVVNQQGRIQSTLRGPQTQAALSGALAKAEKS